LFAVIALSVWALTYLFIGWRLLGPAQLGTLPSALLWLSLGGLMVFVPAAMLLRHRFLERSWAAPLEWAAYLSMGFVSLVFALLVLRDLAVLLARFADSVGVLAGTFRNEGSSLFRAWPADPLKRVFLMNLSSAAVIVLSLVLMAVGWRNAYRPPRISEVKVGIDSLPGGLDGFRIAAISDIHVSRMIGKDYVADIVSRVNALAPDVIVFTGDVADGDAGPLRASAAPLGDLAAKYGKFFVTGNHEYYHSGWIQEIRALGFTILDNENRVITRADGHLVLAGVPDSRTVSGFVKGVVSDPEKAAAGALASDVKVLLAHQPSDAPAAAKAGYDLMISGHSHGGQFFPWNLVVGMFPYSSPGLHQIGKTRSYVSRGAGFWGPPMRLMAPREITLFVLTGGAGAK